MSEKKRRSFSIHFRLLVFVLVMLTGMIPVLVGSSIMTGISYRKYTENVRKDITNRGLIISDKLSRSGYITLGSQDSSIDSEMDMVADMIDGRLVVINRSFRIVSDTFHVAQGKYSIAPEVVRCFKGETSNKFNDDKSYLIQTFPITDNITKDMSGVLLITASTQTEKAYYEELRSNEHLMLIIVGAFICCLGIAAAAIIPGPFVRLKNSLEKASAGNFKAQVYEGTYDITDSISETINGTIEHLKTADQAREDFVANVSHELKTPITSIRILADSLMNMPDCPPELYREFMEDISMEIDRETSIINDLLELVKQDRTNRDMKIAQVDMVALLKLVLKRVRPIATLRNVELIFEQGREITLEGDESQLMIAFTNLVENAVKYNIDGGIVKVTVDADHKDCTVTVQDTGIGIPQEDQNRIFERFYRVDKARSRESGGTGLGLTITMNIVHEHHGTIDLKSDAGEGSVFTVKLPLSYIAQQR